MLSLTIMTCCIDSCNGSARRVLKDLGRYSIEELKLAYQNDEIHAGSTYKEIIKLGELLKSLSE